MSDARQPWLRPAGEASVPYVSSLRQAQRAPTSSGPWRKHAELPAARADAAPETASGDPPRCATCAELAPLRDNLAAARADAIERGRKDGLAETAKLREQLARAIAAVERARGEREDRLIEQVVDLALGLCAELAPAAAAIDRRGLVQLVARSLADAGGARDLQLQVCAEDAAAIGTQLPAGMMCTVRPELVPGEVWVEAPRLVVDGRWATRLAALREPLIALVREPKFELATPRLADAEVAA